MRHHPTRRASSQTSAGAVLLTLAVAALMAAGRLAIELLKLTIMLGKALFDMLHAMVVESSANRRHASG